MDAKKIWESADYVVTDWNGSILPMQSIGKMPVTVVCIVNLAELCVFWLPQCRGVLVEPGPGELVA